MRLLGAAPGEAGVSSGGGLRVQNVVEEETLAAAELMCTVSTDLCGVGGRAGFMELMGFIGGI